MTQLSPSPSQSQSQSPATYTVADIARMQIDIEQRLTVLDQSVRDTRLKLAEQLEALAATIGYPINNLHLVRQHIRNLAAQLHAEARHG